MYNYFRTIHSSSYSFSGREGLKAEVATVHHWKNFCKITNDPAVYKRGS